MFPSISIGAKLDSYDFLYLFQDCLFYTTGRSCCEFVCMDRAVEGKSGGSSYQYFSFLLNLQLEYRLNEQPN